MKFQNPILPGFHPDPSICRAGDDYFLVTSSFEYFPGIPLFHSRDLRHWRQVGHCLTRKSQLPLEGVGNSEGVYAPTIRYHNRRFYMVTTNVTRGGHFVVTTDDPYGTWSEPVWIDQGGIDPSLLFDGGHVYFTSTNTGGGRSETIPPEAGRFGIVQSEIDLSTGRCLSPVRYLWSGTGGKAPEAPHLYHIGDWYYLLIAEGGTEYGHCVTMARSRSPWGAFEAYPHNPILTQRSTDEPVQGAGHADLVQAADGTWWLVCLAFRPTRDEYPFHYFLGRETFLAPVTWTEDGWLQVGQTTNGQVVGRLYLEMEHASRLPDHPWPPAPVRDHFDSSTLNLAWNFLRNPNDEDWSLSARSGWLTLFGSTVTLNDLDSPAFLGRRQQHFACRIETLLDFAPQSDNEEAGLTVRMTETHHYEIAVGLRWGQRIVFVRRRMGSLLVEVAAHALDAGHVQLGILADPHTYTFYYARAGGEKIMLATAETRYLTTEVAGGFVGVYIGMYATGNGQPSRAPAHFDFFDYEPITRRTDTNV